MQFEALWTLVWAKSGNLVPALDDGADGMLFQTAEAAEAEAIRQTDLYADTGAGESIRAVSVSVGAGTCPHNTMMTGRRPTGTPPGQGSIRRSGPL